MVVRKSAAVPRFEEVMDGCYDGNRLEWVNHLRLRGFRFTLLSQSWLYHLRHKPARSSVDADRRQEANLKILQILGYERSQKYAGQWRLPLCAGEESYPNPGMTVEEYLSRMQREDQRKKSKSYLEEEELKRKFAWRKMVRQKQKQERQRQRQQQQQQQQ